MEVEVRNASLQRIGILDQFESLIWTERYCGFGDFEIVSSPSPSILETLVGASYLTLKGSEQVMVLDTIQIRTNVESGNKIFIKGKSLESLLDRRIIWDQTVLTGSFQEGILSLLNQNCISSTNPKRDISRLETETSSDPLILSATLDNQYFGEFVYDVITNLCLVKEFGYKITLTSAGTFLFKLYAGVDRSYSQLLNPYVVFSPDHENLVNSEYTSSSRGYKTTTLVAGEKGVGNVRTIIEISLDSELSDLDRREIFTDASGVTRTTPEGTLTEEEYAEQLTEKGIESLVNNTAINTFDGQADASLVYTFGNDFWLGDIVQVENEYGYKAKSRVTELVRVQDNSGIKVYPIFSTTNQ